MATLLKRIIYLTFWLIFTLISGAAVVSAGVYLYLSPNLPDVEDLYEVKLQIPLRIYTFDGKLIGEFGEQRRSPVSYDQVPKQFVRALLAAEDSNFETHKGVAIRGLMRATSELLTSGEIQTGGSTITMQVARNFFLSREQTFIRKFNEILLALQIERKLSKEQIFELYVNKIFWGNRAYGVEAAARVYYGKGIEDLSLAQHAMIAGLPKAPSTFNPIVNPERALTRRNWILQRMRSLNYIDQASFDNAKAEPVTATLHGAEIEVAAPYAAEMARAELLERYGKEAYDQGMSVYTTIRGDRQQSANQALRAGILDYEQRHGYRGPEAHSFEADNMEQNLINWQAMLDDARTINSLQPAIVTEVADDHIKVLLQSGAKSRVEFANGIEQARQFVSENSLGPEVKSPAEVAKVGDLIRVYPQQFENDQPSQSPTDNQTEDQAKSAKEAASEPETDNTVYHFAQLPQVQSALVSLNPEDGAIHAVVGGFDFESSKFNRAVQGERQPGSNFKPFIYAAALEKGFTAASLFNDAPVVMADAELENTWRPENASGKFYGPTRLRKALYLSRNLVSVRLLRTITPKYAIDYVQAFGFDAERLPKDLSLSLGSHAVTPLGIARGYATFANGGHLIEPHIIDRIVANDGETVFTANPPQANCQDCALASTSSVDVVDDAFTKVSPRDAAVIEGATAEAGANPDTPIAAPRVIEERVAYIVDDFLKDVIRRGTGVKAKQLERADIAGKTGTTNGPVDAWFSGYTTSLVTTVWLGFDQNQPLGKREYGGSAALPIWIDYMGDALAAEPEVFREQPNGITSARIDPETGLLASPLQDDAIFEMFREENVPIERAPDPEPEYADYDDEYYDDEYGDDEFGTDALGEDGFSTDAEQGLGGTDPTEPVQEDAAGGNAAGELQPENSQPAEPRRRRKPRPVESVDDLF